MEATTRVTGDWLPDGHPGYEAIVDPERWNGWAVPRFTEAVARQVATDQVHLAEKDPADDGYDRVIVHEDPLAFQILSGDNADEEGEFVRADPDGLYSIGGWMWCWYEVEEETSAAR